MITEISSAEALRLLPELVDVYLTAFTVPPYNEDETSVARFRDEQLVTHARREGFRCVVARDDGRIVGFAYGYTGRRGQWWSDHVAERVPQELAERWVDGHIEFVELAVHPDFSAKASAGRCTTRCSTVSPTPARRSCRPGPRLIPRGCST